MSLRNNVFVNIVTWNGMKYLPEAIDSLARQTLPDFKITIIDNGSIDGTVDFIRNNFPHFQMLRNMRNLGFAKGHNQGIEFVRNLFYKRGERGDFYQREDGREEGVKDCFILLMNQDIILEPNCLEVLVETLSKKEDVAVVGPKLLRAFWNLETLGSTSEVIRSKIVDSAGLIIKKTRRVIDRGAGDVDGEKYNREGYVFGISGALMMFRLKALEDAKIFRVNNSYIRKGFVINRETSEASGEYFDEDFFSYKEDIDLCWRLQNLGWKAYYQPQAVAYHFRGAKGVGKFSIFNILRERKKKSPLINFWSIRNHLLTIIKNDSLKSFFCDAWAIVPYEFIKFLYIFFFETYNLKAYMSFLKLLPRAIKKRSLKPTKQLARHSFLAAL